MRSSNSMPQASHCSPTKLFLCNAVTPIAELQRKFGPSCVACTIVECIQCSFTSNIITIAARDVLLFVFSHNRKDVRFQPTSPKVFISQQSTPTIMSLFLLFTFLRIKHPIVSCVLLEPHYLRFIPEHHYVSTWA